MRLDSSLVLLDPQDRDSIVGLPMYLDSLGYPTITVHGQRVRLHRFVMNAQPGQLVDHANQNKLDARRANLRITDRSGNAMNAGKKRHNTSGFKGVYLCKQTGRWRAEIRAHGRVIKLGRFKTPEEAAHAYDAAAIKHHGEFACPNFPAAEHGWVHWRDFIDPSDAGATGKGCDV